MENRSSRHGALSLLLVLAWGWGGVNGADQPAIPAETPAEAERRHERVVQRRKSTHIICHRGASEHAHENTLEAFRATFEPRLLTLDAGDAVEGP